MIEQAGHRAVIKPEPLQAPVEGGLTVDDFTVNQEAGGDLPGRAHGPAQPDPHRHLRRGLPGLPLRQRCTTSKTGRKLVLHRRDDLLRAARADWAADTAGLREDYMAHRPNVERAIAKVATWRGRRLSSGTAGWPATTPGSSAAPRH